MVGSINCSPSYQLLRALNEAPRKPNACVRFCNFLARKVKSAAQSPQLHLLAGGVASITVLLNSAGLITEWARTKNVYRLAFSVNVGAGTLSTVFHSAATVDGLKRADESENPSPTRCCLVAQKVSTIVTSPLCLGLVSAVALASTGLSVWALADFAADPHYNNSVVGPAIAAFEGVCSTMLNLCSLMTALGQCCSQEHSSSSETSEVFPVVAV